MNTFFEKFGLAFVVSLPSCTERRERTIHEFTKWNIPFMFVDAIDRADVTIPEDFNTQWLSKTDPKAVGYYACYLSHIKAIKYALSLGFSRFSIFEDDIEFPSTFDWMLDKYKKEIPDGWYMLNWSAHHLEGHEQVSDNVYRIKGMIGAFAYALTNVGAIELLNTVTVQYKTFYDIGMVSFNNYYGASYTFRDRFVLHREGNSVITGQWVDEGHLPRVRDGQAVL